MTETKQIEKYTPALWEWLVPMVLMVVALAVGERAHAMLEGQEVEAWPAWVMLGGTAVGWVVAWRQREKSPRLRELAGVAAAGCWCMSAVWADAAYNLNNTELTLWVCFLGLAWVPWVLRQRVVLGGVMLLSCFITPILVSALHNLLPLNKLSDLPSIINPAVWLPLLPVLLLYGWWMLAERLREHKGRYAGYGWVGMPTCSNFQSFVVFCILGLEPGLQPLIPAAGMTLIALLLRPRVAWQAWLVAVAAAVLPLAVCELADASLHARWVAALLFPVAMLVVAVVQRRREWVPCSTFTLFILITFHPVWHSVDSPLSYYPAILTVLTLLTIYLYRKACTPAPSHD